MTESEIEAIRAQAGINTIISQRDRAMGAWAEVAGQAAVLTAQLEEANQRIAELKAKQAKRSKAAAPPPAG